MARNRKDRERYLKTLPVGANVVDKERGITGTVIRHGVNCLRVSYWPVGMIDYDYSEVRAKLLHPDEVF